MTYALGYLISFRLFRADSTNSTLLIFSFQMGPPFFEDYDIIKTIKTNVKWAPTKRAFIYINV